MDNWHKPSHHHGTVGIFKLCFGSFSYKVINVIRDDSIMKAGLSFISEYKSYLNGIIYDQVDKQKCKLILHSKRSKKIIQTKVRDICTFFLIQNYWAQLIRILVVGMKCDFFLKLEIFCA